MKWHYPDFVERTDYECVFIRGEMVLKQVGITRIMSRKQVLQEEYRGCSIYFPTIEKLHEWAKRQKKSSLLTGYLLN